jgi:periplasmic protein TonB
LKFADHTGFCGCLRTVIENKGLSPLANFVGAISAPIFKDLAMPPTKSGVVSKSQMSEGGRAMFDKLVESSKQKQKMRAGPYMVVTTLIYAVTLIAFAVGAIIIFSPVLAEEYSLLGRLTPPHLPEGPSPEPVTQHTKATSERNTFVPPARLPKEIPPATDTHTLTLGHLVVRGAPLLFDDSRSNGAYGLDKGEPVPPPPVKPTPKIDPVNTLEVKPHGPTRISEGVLQGIAIRKEKPSYPAIATKVRASGPVQVLVTISEEGRVTEAIALNGHPMLKPVAVEAARKWLFSPTTLSRVPVKVQGVLTFNFILE